MTPYRKSNSLVLRKFKIGAKAVGSLSINIWKWRDKYYYVIAGLNQPLQEKLLVMIQGVQKYVHQNDYSNRNDTQESAEMFR